VGVELHRGFGLPRRARSRPREPIGRFLRDAVRRTRTFPCE
jgi:hypothetical protein